jgi:hypothetical protein
MKPQFSTVIIVASTFLLGSCALVDLSGRLTRKTGEAMSEYSENHDGTLGKVVGVGGKINVAVGSALESLSGMERKGADQEMTAPPANEQNPAAEPLPSSPPEEQVVLITQEPGTGIIIEKISSQTEGMSVFETQRVLTRLGYNPGGIDGRLGPKTAGALKKFQTDHDLPVTGELDDATISRLRTANPSQ